MIVVKLASYRKKDWKKLMNIIVDRESMHDSWDEWYEAFLKTKKEMISQGFKVIEIQVKLSELKSYCENREIENNGKARSQFVQTK